jgi:hypothetical protein
MWRDAKNLASFHSPSRCTSDLFAAAAAAGGVLTGVTLSHNRLGHVAQWTFLNVFITTKLLVVDCPKSRIITAIAAVASLAAACCLLCC